MSNIPGFFDQFQPPAEPPPPVLATRVSKGTGESSSKVQVRGPFHSRRLSFTIRDWEFLDYLCEHPNATNGDLGKLFGTTLSAASLRVKRLAKLGLIEVSYESWQDTGKVNRRTVNVLHVPEKPWSPDDPSAL